MFELEVGGINSTMEHFNYGTFQLWNISTMEHFKDENYIINDDRLLNYATSITKNHLVDGVYPTSYLFSEYKYECGNFTFSPLNTQIIFDLVIFDWLHKYQYTSEKLYDRFNVLDNKYKNLNTYENITINVIRMKVEYGFVDKLNRESLIRKAKSILQTESDFFSPSDKYIQKLKDYIQEFVNGKSNYNV